MTDISDKPVGNPIVRAARAIFMSMGILPVLLIGSVVFFGLMEERFLDGRNLFNVVRQTTYLAIVSIGQMVCLLTAGFDLSIGSTMALASVVSALVMVSVLATTPEAYVMAIVLGLIAGIGVGIIVGSINGVGVAIFNVPPFMMTLGMLSVALGAALTIGGGVPIYGIPKVFKEAFGYGRLFDIPAPLFYMAGIAIIVFFTLNWTKMGRYFYAIGSNRRAARLSGVKTRKHLFFAYVICGVTAACVGLLLMARTGTGEATIGQPLVLQSVAACVIGGVSLFGGIGRLENVLLGAFFITLLTNGMNLIRMDSYVQQIVLGSVLILAIVVDQVRLRYMGQLRVD